ncbi:hypothetical protein [Pseudonocardia dioxanivorans]|uniref:hypothetical protein n=1 Tax=Pseudonocardia dioxanivorans TaxID=240495 RepID=UPI0010479986|nr:hypothetical protein [Pseudonocardia dioxanivorans]
MTTNTAHANCSHEVTKSARSKCRRAKGASAYTATKTAKRVGLDMIETCSCNGPAVEGICMLCDRLADCA